MKIFIFLLAFLPSICFGQIINQGEYFFDIDPGYGNGTALSVTTPGGQVTINQMVSTTGLNPGLHVLFIRLRDDNDSWSNYEGRLVTVQDTTPPSDIVQGEYFFNIDPGIGNGTPLSITNPGSQVTINNSINTSALQSGSNVMFSRFRDASGQWSLNEGRIILVQDTTNQIGNIVAMEYFIDSVGAIGTGTPISINDPGTIITEVDSIVVPSLTLGLHRLFVRAMDDKGRWSLYEPRDFEVCSTYGPLSRFDLFRKNNTIYLDNYSEYVNQFEWNFGDNTTESFQVNPKHTYTNLGTYTVQLTTTNLCDSDTVSHVVIIDGLEEISPNYSAHTGFVRAKISGYGFSPGAEIKLIQSGQPDILADTTMLVDIKNYIANFKFANSPTGMYNLVIDDPGGLADTLFNAFEIQQPVPFESWFEIIGPSRLRTGANNHYQIAVGNGGNTTEYGIPVTILLDSSWSAYIQNPIYTDSLPQQVTDTLMPFYIFTDSLTNESWLLGSYAILSLGPGEIEYLDIYLNSPVDGPFEIETNIGPPLFESSQINLLLARSSSASNCTSLPDCMQCLLDLMGFVPGVGCLVGIFDIGCAIKNNIEKPTAVNAINIIGAAAGTFFACFTVTNLPKAIKTAVEYTGKLGNAASGYGAFGSCKKCIPKPTKKIPTESVTSRDPNVKEGPVEITPDNFISGRNPVYYSIYFENADTATAPAAQVRITDQLDTAMYDLSTLRFINYGFGDTIINAPDAYGRFAADHDSVSQDIVLRVMADLDTETGFLEWTYTSFDTDTMVLTNDPTLGFLPPNVNKPEGEGFIRFSVELKPGYDHLDVINNEADIYFDFNAPISTPVWTNTIDTVPPSSNVMPLPVTHWDSTFVVRWTGNDTDAGLGYYNIYVSENDSAYTNWLYAFRGDSAVFTGQNGKKYEFYSVAVDRVLNTELAPPNPDTNPDAVTTTNFNVGTPEHLTSNITLSIYPNPVTPGSIAEFTLPYRSSVELVISDLSGRILDKIVDGNLQHGLYRVKLPTNELSNGLYFLGLNINGRSIFTRFIKSE